MYRSSHVSFVAPAVDRAGEAVVLKVQFPHRESTFEADALACWDGGGAVRLVACDRERHALLVERCEPGTHLSRESELALDVLVGLLPRLWVEVDGPFDSLAAEAARWHAGIEREWVAADRPYERRLLDVALEALRDLPSTQAEQVLVHQDLHADNVLAAAREPWLVIDPKPLIGERAFSVAPIVRSFELGHSRTDVHRRLDRCVGDLVLDRDRVVGWVVAQTLAWACSDGMVHQPHHLDTVRWLLD
jgi:streptomycin 6-kinase